MSSDTVMVRFMNQGRAAQGVYARGARVYIQPGQLRDLEMTQLEWDGWSDKDTVKAQLVGAGGALLSEPVQFDQELLEKAAAGSESAQEQVMDQLKSAQDASVPPEEPEEPAKTTEYISKHRGGGSYSVMDGDTEVVPGLDKEASLAFNALEPDEQQAWVAARLEEVNS